MMNSTQELFSPSEQTIMLLCNVARQYAAMRQAGGVRSSRSSAMLEGQA